MSAPAATQKLCPTCRKPAQQKFRPFCSRRCADVDLHRWFAGVYAVPAVEANDDGEDTERERKVGDR